MALNAGDVIRVVMQANLPQSSVGQLVFHYLVSSGSGGDEATVLAAIVSLLGTVLENNDVIFDPAIQSTQAELFKYDFTLHRWDGLVSQAWSTFNGAGLAEGLPNQIAPLIKMFTTKARRQARKYLFPIVENQQNDGQLEAATVLILLDIADVFTDAVGTSGLLLVPCVFNVEPTSPLYETAEQIIDSYGVQTYLSTQRRRKPGVGI